MKYKHLHPIFFHPHSMISELLALKVSIYLLPNCLSPHGFVTQIILLPNKEKLVVVPKERPPHCHREFIVSSVHFHLKLHTERTACNPCFVLFSLQAADIAEADMALSEYC